MVIPLISRTYYIRCNLVISALRKKNQNRSYKYVFVGCTFGRNQSACSLHNEIGWSRVATAIFKRRAGSGHGP